MYWFTSDEHYRHKNILKYQPDRPGNTIEEMEETFIQNHNELVSDKDITIHIGDFCWPFCPKKEIVQQAFQVIGQLKGKHIFLPGSHDRWLKQELRKDYYDSKIQIVEPIWELKYKKRHIVCCHYPMLQWPRSHYGSWHLHGHSHSKLDHRNLINKGLLQYINAYDIGVDNNNYRPVSYETLVFIFENKAI